LDYWLILIGNSASLHRPGFHPDAQSKRLERGTSRRLVKNIDLTKLSDLDAIVAALDTVNGLPFTAAIFSRSGVERIEMAILVNAQTNKIENGLYWFTCSRGLTEVSKVARLSPFLRNPIAYIGRSRCLVWQGDTYGENEMWITSDKPIGANSSAPRVSIGNGVHEWVRSRPLIAMESKIAETAGELIYTKETAIVPNQNDTVVIDGVGAINLPVDPIPNFTFKINDTKYKRLTEGRNPVNPQKGQTIGKGQTLDTSIDLATPFLWGKEDAGAVSTWLWEAEQSNWIVTLRRASESGTTSPYEQSPLIITGKENITAKPYDRFFLSGNGNILVTQIVKEGQYIDIEWAAKANWNMRVVCPVGYTFGGVFEDLEIDTALTGVNHLKVALMPNKSFAVSA
jgi:hypothetical protein